MHGKNERKKPTNEKFHFEIVDIFPTIQGEGPYVGTPAVFVRFAHCHLACDFCDTDFSSTYKTYSLSEIRQEVQKQAHAHERHGNTERILVVLTGGEPFRHDLTVLIHQLNQDHCRVQIETAGQFWRPTYVGLFGHGSGSTYDNAIVCSPKTPTIDPYIAKTAIAFKYIIRTNAIDKKNGLPRDVYHPSPYYPRSHIFLQPCDERSTRSTNTNIQTATELCLLHGYRLSLQTHKLIGLP